MFQQNSQPDKNQKQLEQEYELTLPQRDRAALSDAAGSLILKQGLGCVALAGMAIAHMHSGEPFQRTWVIPISDRTKVLSVEQRDGMVIIESESGTIEVSREHCAFSSVPDGAERYVAEFKRERRTRGTIFSPARTELLQDNLVLLHYHESDMSTIMPAGRAQDSKPNE